MQLFYFVIGFVILQRIVELLISKRNEKWLVSNGAKEFGNNHYKFIVLMHVCFCISMLIEDSFQSHRELNTINYLFLVFFIILQILRLWVLISLGKFWNTKIFRIPGGQLVARGPYKYMKHPNYVIVACEIFSLPLIFNLYYTAIIFSIINSVLLTIRIKEENKVLIL